MSKYFTNYIALILIILSIVVSSCKHRNSYTISTGSESGKPYNIGVKIADILNSQTDDYYTLNTEGEGSINNAKMVATGKCDFALVQNDFGIDEINKIRTVMPLYPQVLFIVYHPSLTVNSLRDLICGRQIVVGPKDDATAKLAQKLLTNYGIIPHEYNFIYPSY